MTANPYNRLYLAWVAHDRAKAGTRRRSGEPLAPDELASIPDASLRHRVVLLMADNHSLRSRVNILETLDGKQVVRIEGGVTTVATPPQPKGACPDLDADDLDAIRDFLDPRKMSARGYRFAEGRGLVAAGGHVIAEPDFIDALAKVVGVRP